MSAGTGRSSLRVPGQPVDRRLPAERRREGRETVVRQVEYSPYPRVRMGQRRCLGFTRDVSASGLCLRAEDRPPVGSLLRLVVHDVDGRPALESIGRVAWCNPAADGACWVGLSLLSSRSGQ